VRCFNLYGCNIIVKTRFGILLNIETRKKLQRSFEPFGIFIPTSASFGTDECVLICSGNLMPLAYYIIIAGYISVSEIILYTSRGAPRCIHYTIQYTTTYRPPCSGHNCAFGAGRRIEYLRTTKFLYRP